MKKNIFNLIIILISLAVPFVVVFSTQSFGNFLQQISKLDARWIILSLAFMFLYWFFESLSLHVISVFHGIKEKISHSFSYTMVGQFFNSITPFQTGGQPAQVVYMMKNGINSGNASSIVMIKFVAFQSVLTIYSLVVILFTYKDFSAKVPFLFPFTVLGLGVHASMIGISMLFSYNRTLTERILKFIFKTLKKIKIFKGDEVEAEKNLENSLSKFHDNAYLLKKNPKLLIKLFILTMIQLSFFFSIPYLIYRGFGGGSSSYFELFAAAVFIATVISIIPLPGAAGGAEISSYTFFHFFFEGNAVFTAMLLWRIITFYSCIGFGGLFTVVCPNKSKKVVKEKE
ncbi:lysylphosphatidylglycerol synthase transmembrane domain-containing protein [Pseudobacteroides cellulosolvens]|uniref:Phosphatidylglycerol lysyltransferase n=1 Tax=Pseudobacteroides cellulosolvens ATCC 35603 = DSM 2933 TaxID=398512 RepID=A0A0L6JRC2_9FIRM|nr:lysylphosphatidylglycerol synthase transmembrane domain-containing protein [Pseudobacteroides cellulosolvens]KNY28220.1 Lysylphosphatidylglycerol synthetase/glycosyltransferase AglD [Pseudobacteroides cellulosolvens ATCC 35603 = DSM 2933]